MRKIVKLSNSDINRMVSESKRRILSELDWKTYDSAMRKSAEKGDWKRAGEFGDASKDAFNRDFGTHNSVYDYNYRRERTPYYGEYDYDEDTDDFVKNGKTGSNRGWYSDSVEAAKDGFYPDSLERVVDREINHMRDMRGKFHTNMRDMDAEDNWESDNWDNIWDDNDSLADATHAARRGGRETRDYLQGNYEYEKGQGWKKKSDSSSKKKKSSKKKTDESIRRSVNNAIRRYLK